MTEPTHTSLNDIITGMHTTAYMWRYVSGRLHGTDLPVPICDALEQLCDGNVEIVTKKPTIPPKPKTEFKPILCLDFDGVCHSYASGWVSGDVVQDEPVPGMASFIKEAVLEFNIAIFSSRSHMDGGTKAMHAWFVKHLGAELTAQLSFPLEKPPAMVTLDDRAITFDGIWPSVNELKDFKPWNKK